jgi:hypothetical protein
MTRHLLAVLILLLLAPAASMAAEPDDTAKVLEKYKPTVDKGLKWLADQQQKDGSWQAGDKGEFKTSMTAFAGLALLSEGSTTKDGKYKDQLRKAVDWMLAQAREDGELGDPKAPGEAGRYVMGHGCALLFLTQVYAKEADDKRKKELSKTLEKAVAFSVKCQGRWGGWGYVDPKEGGEFAEGCATEIQLHALLAARKAGIDVPEKVVKDARRYLTVSSVPVKDDPDVTKRQAGMMYSFGVPEKDPKPKPALTAGGVAALLTLGEAKSPLTVQWVNYLQDTLPLTRGKLPQCDYNEFLHLHYAQMCYLLGEEGHAKMRPDLAEAEKKPDAKPLLLKWSRCREVMFEGVAKAQQETGAWKGTAGEVYPTATYLIILQLDKENLPYCKR